MWRVASHSPTERRRAQEEVRKLTPVDTAPIRVPSDVAMEEKRHRFQVDLTACGQASKQWTQDFEVVEFISGLRCLQLCDDWPEEFAVDSVSYLARKTQQWGLLLCERHDGIVGHP